MNINQSKNSINIKAVTAATIDEFPRNAEEEKNMFLFPANPSIKPWGIN